MKFGAYLGMAGAWILLASPAWADDPTPQDVPPTAIVVQPTAPPVVDTAPTPAPPVVDSTPMAPAREHSQPTASVPESVDTGNNAAPTPGRYESGPAAPGVTLNPNPQPQSRSPVARVTGSGSPVYGPASAVGASAPADVSSITAPYISVPAQAPSQLTCKGKQQGNALPFLVSPYSGWTEFVSFVDHDSPDYTVDGSIVLANGISATSGDGQESDLFPAYWSPSLRQFVNYDGHNGYDFALSYQPVLAAGNGTVRFAGWNSSDEYAGYGQMVLIDHHNGYVTLYGHLSTIEVKQGEKVSAGQEIGVSGTTGHSSGPHLHFSVFHNCHVTDPYGWTGEGTDPLYTFDGEHATYLWLPGRDPLVVNPPRNWPTFPLGLQLNLSPFESGQARNSRSGSAALPSIDRLLLLNLPESASVGTSSPAVALARTEASITQEAELLAPALEDLKSQGLLQRYAVIPAAAAVWLRGTASASQLLSLPGVASLAGVQPHDLSAAQTGLAHAVLIQIQRQQSSSLWPPGFRSALHPWRPIMTVVNRHALVTGIALPGQHVALSVRRKGAIAGVAESTGDVNTGGFVAMLHDLAGNPVTTRAGDVVTVEAGGKSDVMTIAPFTLEARSDGLAGVASIGASIPLALTRVGEGVSSETVVSTGSSGAFSLSASRAAPEATLHAGDLAVGTVADSGGNQEAASAFVPGSQIYEGSALVRGWTVGYNPRLVLTRGGKILVDTRIHSAPDGTFQLELHRHEKLLSLRKGDVLRIGSRLHPRTVTLPELSVIVRSGTHSIPFAGPPNTPVVLTFTRANGRTSVRTLHTDSVGKGTLSVTGGPLALGDTATLASIARTGDQIIARDQARGILLQEGNALVSGTVRPGTVVSLHVLSSGGTQIAGSVVTADRLTGAFKARMLSMVGRPVRLRASMQMLVRDGALETSTSIPAIRLSQRGSSIVTRAVVSARQKLTWTAVDQGGAVTVRQIQAGAHGQVVDRFSTSRAARFERVSVTLSLSDGVTVERTLHLPTGARSKSVAGLPLKRVKCSSSRSSQRTNKSGAGAKCTPATAARR